MTRWVKKNCYKIHTLLMKSSAYTLLYTSPYMDYPLPFLQESLEPPFYDFSDF